MSIYSLTLILPRPTNSILLLLLLLLLLPPVLPRPTKAILFATSKFWFNYRQGAGILSLYRLLRSQGLSKEDIVLLVPDNLACNPRNNMGQVVNCVDGDSTTNDYAYSLVDYKQNDVSVDAFLALLLNRHPPHTPVHRRLTLPPHSRLMVYLSGHGGDNYAKIMDTGVLYQEFFFKTAQELVKHNPTVELLLINDSCEAFSMFDDFHQLERTLSIGSSVVDIMSVSSGFDSHLQLSKTDQFTQLYIQQALTNPHSSFMDFFASLQHNGIPRDHFGYHNNLDRPIEQVRLSHFMSASHKPPTRVSLQWHQMEQHVHHSL